MSDDDGLKEVVESAFRQATGRITGSIAIYFAVRQWLASRRASQVSKDRLVQMWEKVSGTAPGRLTMQFIDGIIALLPEGRTKFAHHPDCAYPKGECDCPAQEMEEERNAEILAAVLASRPAPVVTEEWIENWFSERAAPQAMTLHPGVNRSSWTMQLAKDLNALLAEQQKDTK